MSADQNPDAVLDQSPDLAADQSPDLAVERVGGTMVITFNRPAVLNAFRDRTFQELRAALTEAE
jgi:enoyl-CoA hydratase/carnithine racemase